MPITPEQKTEIAQFPAALRQLIESELAAGNTIVEIGHSFPAPPAGAYLKLAKQVTTRARADGEGLRFYERNSSSYSGEFTDAKRFYFVLEPPNPPPPELDMDAIRRSWEQQPTVPTERTQVEVREESAIGATRLLHFCDQLPPQEVQFALERTLRTLFTRSMEEGLLCFRAKANVVGATYNLLLRFEVALPEWNYYSLRAEAVWGVVSSDHAEYYRKTAGSWFEHWTSDFQAANPPQANEGSATRYRELCEEGLNAEKELDSVAAIQQTIIAAIKRGARYSDSHKEGGTHIGWKVDRYIRSDYGDDPNLQHFTDDQAFLKMLYQFCHWNATRNATSNQLSELDTWRLILRQMRHP